MIDWSRSYASHWRVFAVEPSTWADGAELAGVDSVGVTYDASGTAPTVCAGTVGVTGDPPPRGWYRIVLTAEQDGALERVDVATLELVGGKGKAARGTDSMTLTGRSVLHPATTARIGPGDYAPAGTDGAGYTARLLRACCVAPVTVVGEGFRLAEAVVPEDGARPLDVAWQVARAGNHIIRVDGAGRISVMPLPTSPALDLRAAGAALLMPEADWDEAVADVPNRYTAIDGTQRAVAENTDPASPTSYPSVGYWVDADYDADPVRVAGETLAAYAMRRLREESTVTRTRTYRRAWWPGVYPGDVVRGTEASVRLDGDLRIERQSLACGRGIVVTERASMEEALWT